MRVLFVFVLSLFVGLASAQVNGYTYIYIQGDQETPFYVKLEGQMLPRLGKNYCIIPNLDAGNINVQILFQQNTYPQQNFVINVPTNRARGFVLQKINDQQFALMDLYTKKYIVAGNTKDESDISSDSNIKIADNSSTSNSNLPTFSPNKNNDKNEVKNVDTSSRFLDQLELNNDKPKKNTLPEFKPKEKKEANNFENGIPIDTHEQLGFDSSSSTNKPSSKKIKPNKKSSGEVVEATNQEVFAYENKNATSNETSNTSNIDKIPNSDCPEAMDNMTFENFALKALDKEGEEVQLRYLLKSGVKNCYTTEQVRILAENLESQSARYELITTYYPRVVDAEKYSSLEKVFISNFLKKKFLATLK